MIDIKEILTKNSFYTQQAPGTLLFVCCAALSCHYMKKSLGYSYEYFLYKFENESFEMNYTRFDLERLRKIVLENLKKDDGYFLKVKQMHDSNFNAAWDEFQKQKKTNPKNYSDKELKESFVLAFRLLAKGVGEGHLIESFAITHDHALRDGLKKHIKNTKELNRAINVLTTPTKKSFAGQQQDDLRRIAKITDKEKIKQEIEKHVKEFIWIKNNYSGSYPLTVEEVKEELKSLKDLKKNKENIVDEQKKIIKKYDLDKEIVTLCQRLVFLTDWQDERKEKILKGIGEVDFLLREISSRVDIPFELMKFCTHKEVEEGVDKSFEPELKKRMEYFLAVHRYDDEIVIVTGKEGRDLYESAQLENKDDSKTINGMCASLGKVIGTVQICRNMKDIANFKEGRVLVTSMTRPEFVPAMKKAVAIITDEGGITCHAAIVSRELGIPCVIGTKNATKVLKDGDLVEVKANHGQVIVK